MQSNEGSTGQSSAGAAASRHTGAATFDHCSATAAIFGSSKASISLGWMCQPRNAKASEVRLEPVPEPTSSSRPVLFGRWRRAAWIARSLESELIPREVERANRARARSATSGIPQCLGPASLREKERTNERIMGDPRQVLTYLLTVLLTYLSRQ